MNYSLNLNVDHSPNVDDKYLVDVNYGPQEYQIAAVPGPEAGTGLAGLAMAGLGFLVYRRKQNAA